MKLAVAVAALTLALPFGCKREPASPAPLPTPTPAPIPLPMRPALGDDVLADITGVLCSRGLGAPNACAKIRLFAKATTPQSEDLVDQRLLGYGYHVQRSYRRHQPSTYFGTPRIGEELYLFDGKLEEGRPRVAFVPLSPETAEEFRDVPLAIEAIAAGQPIPESNVAWIFARDVRLPDRRYVSVHPTPGTSLLFDYELVVHARVTQHYLFLVETNPSSPERHDFYLWIFPRYRRLPPPGSAGQ